jgi:hypothetical protein
MARLAEYGVGEWSRCLQSVVVVEVVEVERCVCVVVGWSGVLENGVLENGVLEYWSTYSVLLTFGGDGTLISGKAGVRNKLKDQAACYWFASRSAEKRV